MHNFKTFDNQEKELKKIEFDEMVTDFVDGVESYKVNCNQVCVYDRSEVRGSIVPFPPSYKGKGFHGEYKAKKYLPCHILQKQLKEGYEVKEYDYVWSTCPSCNAERKLRIETERSRREHAVQEAQQASYNTIRMGLKQL